VAALQLGHGYTATVRVVHVVSGSDAYRTLVIRHGATTVLRFEDRDTALKLQAVDISGDGVKDVLALDYTDGSGGCGSYRLYGGSPFRELWVREMCADTGMARIDGGALVAWTAVDSSKDPASHDAIHCCWTVWRRTEWRWRDDRLARARTTTGPAPPDAWRERPLGAP
jgi:hypothetical protein